MKRKKPTVADWQAHFPEWKAACKEVKKATLKREKAMKDLAFNIDMRDELLTGEMTMLAADALRELEPAIDALAKKFVARCKRLKRACKRANDISDKYAYWR